jgi:ketosteroid isomerase-like protein
MEAKRIEQAVIQWECQQLLNRMTNLMDQQDWQALANCYTEDAVLSRPSDPDNPIHGRQEILESFTTRSPRISGHSIVNSVFTIVNQDYVKASSRVWLISGPTDQPSPVIANSPLLIGSYTDHIKRQDNQWLVALRDGNIEIKFVAAHT